MTAVLVNTIAFNGLVVGVPTVLPHGLRRENLALTPDVLFPSQPGFTITANTTTVTVTRVDAALPANMTVLVAHLHSIIRALPPGTINLTPQPFIPNYGAGAAGGNTLDQAYDQGGAGAGRIITADAGAVEVQGADGLAVENHVDWGAGSTAAVGGAGTGRIRFNETTNIFEASENGAAYVPLISAGGDDPVVFEGTQPADAATMTIAPLDGDTDGIYEIYGALVLDSNAFQLHWRPNGSALGMVGFYLNNGVALTPPDWRFYDVSAGTAPPHVVRMKAVLWAKRDFGGVLGNQNRFIETWAGGQFNTVAATDDRRQSGYWQTTAANLTSMVIETTGGNILQGSWVAVRRMGNLVY